MGARNKQGVRIARWATVAAIVLAVLFGGNTGSLAAEAGDGDDRGANTSEDRPARSRPPYAGVWGIWGAENLNATGNPQQTAVTVTKTNSGTWKEVSVDISHGNFENRCPHNTDIMLTNVDDEDDVFHMIELTRASAR